MKAWLALLFVFPTVSCRRDDGRARLVDAAPVAASRLRADGISEASAIEVASRYLQLHEPNQLEAFLVRADEAELTWNVVFFPRLERVVGGNVTVVVDKWTGEILKSVIGQ